MKSSISLVVGCVLIISVGGLVYWQTTDTPAPQNTENTQGGGNTEVNKGMTSADVAMHSDATSCWAIINGNVYDLTSWIPKHPGGPGAILKLCGTNGSEEFNEQHGGAALQAQVLAGFKIGVLTQ